MDLLLKYPRTWCRILQFYFKSVQQFGRVHPELPSGGLIRQLDSQALPIEVTLNGEFAAEFNAACKALGDELVATHGDPKFEPILAGCYLVRTFQCFVVWAYGWQLGLLSGLLQFVIAPLSLTGSLIRLFTNLSDALIHYAISMTVSFVCSCTIGEEYSMLSPTFKIDRNFVAGFFVLDFALNLFVYLRTAERWDVSRFVKHVCYGTFNTKTYFVVVLGVLYSFEFNLLVAALASLLTHVLAYTGYQQKLLDFLGWPCFQVAFYVEHRMGHMPVNYQHGHKMHHYLHDTTAFDAHVYGSGMNEEFFWILTETLPCLVFPHLAFPYFLNLVTLHSSWTNKGAHSRTSTDTGIDTFGCFDEDNHHADHHTYHRANFGSSTAPIIDVYFGTQAPGGGGSGRRAYEVVKSSQADAQSGTVIVRITEAAPKAVKPAMTAAKSVQDASARHCDVPTAPGGRLGTFSLQDLSKKRAEAADSLWVALHGGVFDLTSFQRIHPGGAEVLKMYAGTDATKDFDDVGHSKKAKLMARKRLIGFVEGQKPTDFVAEKLVANDNVKPTAPNRLIDKIKGPLFGVFHRGARIRVHAQQ